VRVKRDERGTHVFENSGEGEYQPAGFPDEPDTAEVEEEGETGVPEESGDPDEVDGVVEGLEPFHWEEDPGVDHEADLFHPSASEHRTGRWRQPTGAK
jgi:hypothetical protein